MSLLRTADTVMIDVHEHYRKGTYRNRCHIMGPNGLLKLSVPLIKGKFQHTPMGQVRISYKENWRKDHWMSLVSSYRRSAYFEYYEDDIAPIYKEEYEFLWQLNVATLDIVMRLLQHSIYLVYTDAYYKPGQFKGCDIRNTVLPNTDKSSIHPSFGSYPQVFNDRMPFMKDLCILDLLFNLGPRASTYLADQVNI